MSNESQETRQVPQPDAAGPSEDELEQEFYTALRAAGASPEEAQTCMQCAAPVAGR